MTGYKSGYKVISAPVVEPVRMEREELERLCHEKRIPLFHLKVEETVSMGIVQPCKPYMKYFTIYEQQWFTATEKIEEKEGAQQ